MPKKEYDTFRLLDGGKSDTKPKRPRKEGVILRCPCGSNAFRERILGPRTDGSRTWGGTKQLVCDECGMPYSAR